MMGLLQAVLVYPVSPSSVLQRCASARARARVRVCVCVRACVQLLSLRM